MPDRFVRKLVSATAERGLCRGLRETIDGKSGKVNGRDAFRYYVSDYVAGPAGKTPAQASVTSINKKIFPLCSTQYWRSVRGHRTTARPGLGCFEFWLSEQVLLPLVDVCEEFLKNKHRYRP